MDVHASLTTQEQRLCEALAPLGPHRHIRLLAIRKVLCRYGHDLEAMGHPFLEAESQTLDILMTRAQKNAGFPSPERSVYALPNVWLYGFFRRISQEALRKLTPPEWLGELPKTPMDIPAADRDPESLVISQDELAALRARLQAVNPAHSLVVLLFNAPQLVSPELIWAASAVFMAPAEDEAVWQARRESLVARIRFWLEKHQRARIVGNPTVQNELIFLLQTDREPDEFEAWARENPLALRRGRSRFRAQIKRVRAAIRHE